MFDFIFITHFWLGALLSLSTLVYGLFTAVHQAVLLKEATFGFIIIVLSVSNLLVMSSIDSTICNGQANMRADPTLVRIMHARGKI